MSSVRIQLYVSISRCKNNWGKIYNPCVSETTLIYLIWLSPVFAFIFKKNSITSFFFMAEKNSHCVYTTYLFIRSSPDGHPVCFHNLVIVSCAVVKTDMWVPLRYFDLKAFGQISKCGQLNITKFSMNYLLFQRDGSSRDIEKLRHCGLGKLGTWWIHYEPVPLVLLPFYSKKFPKELWIFFPSLP